MSSTAIVTDSTSDMSVEVAEENKITLVPLPVIFDNESFKDGRKQLAAQHFYKIFGKPRSLPETAQPSPGDFINIYSKLFEKHKNTISIHISKKMSGTIASAEAAKKSFTRKRIEIVGSELYHMPLGFLAIRAARPAGEGKSFNEIISFIRELKARIKALLIPRILGFLQKMEMIGRVKSLIASILEIKLVLTLKYGEISQFKTTRRWKQAKSELIESIKSMVHNPGNMAVSIIDSNSPQDGEEMKQRIGEIFKPKQLLRFEFGCILAPISGPAL